MILINKELPTQRIIVTGKENSGLDNSFFKLKLHSNYTNKDYEVDLGESVSAFPDRYDEFVLNTSSIAAVEPGKYSYELMVGVDMVERGVVSVIDKVVTPADQYVTVPTVPVDDDYVVFK